MNLSEFTSKELLSQYGVAATPARLATTAEEAERLCRELDARRFVVKAQIGAGARADAGGVIFAATPSAVRQAAADLLGKPLVTEQTGAAGQVVNAVTVEAAVDIAQQVYVALVLDPVTAQPTLLASPDGGSDFEALARARPHSVHRLALPQDGVESAIAGLLATLDLPDEAAGAKVIAAAARAFTECDMALLEINPLAFTGGGRWLAVDAKIVLDRNALFRHPEFRSLTDDQALTEAERIAQENEINLVKLDGNIGVVVNGAGLGLATNDMIADAGGRPANFMDIRTTATSFHIARGVELLLADKTVKTILVNVHGGGMTVCDTVAEGVAFAYSRAGRSVPIVARMAGQSAEWALRIFRDRRLPVEVCDDITSAVARAVAIATKGGR